jgi:hypothetical protein
MPSKFWKRETARWKWVIGSTGHEIGASATAKRFGISRGQVRHHMRKVTDPSFHSLPWGGKRRQAFSEKVAILVRQQLWNNVQKDPFQTIGEHLCFLRRLGIPVRKDYIRRIFFEGVEVVMEDCRSCSDPEVHGSQHCRLPSLGRKYWLYAVGEAKVFG